MRPEVLNTRSQLADVAGTPRYCLAILDRFGRSASCLGHHSSMSSSIPASGNSKYISSSDFAAGASSSSDSAGAGSSQMAATVPMNAVKEPRLEQSRFGAGSSMRIGWAAGSEAGGAGDQCAMYSDSNCFSMKERFASVRGGTQTLKCGDNADLRSLRVGRSGDREF